ncbi:MAG TPA: hypothetical protein VFB42_06085 [Gaiellaceae bacterium]|nr:hypothetical protein [Gaiellaceae bacterium]
MRKALAVSIVALVCAPAGQGAAATHRAGQATLPAHGVLSPGVSLAGVRIGYTVAKVKKLWGSNYKVCPECKSPTWYYIYTKGEPLGAAVKFKKGRVVAAFTLGSPTGWRTTEGLLMGEQIDKVSRLYGSLGWHVCIGYGAMSMRNGNTVTSIYTTGEAVYGFAITAPAEPVCQ